MAKLPSKPEAPVENPELADEQPPMQLEQNESGLWEYWRDAWKYGPAIEKNGVMPVSTETREEAEAYVNRLYPGSFPEPEAEAKE